MQKWEYKVVPLTQYFGGEKDQEANRKFREVTLNANGDDGWELVAYVPSGTFASAVNFHDLVFKRPKA